MRLNSKGGTIGAAFVGQFEKGFEPPIDFRRQFPKLIFLDSIGKNRHGELQAQIRGHVAP